MNRLLQRFVLPMMLFTAISTLPSCYTYNSISKDELINGYPRPEQAVRITLKDGSVIDSPEYLHILTTNQSDLIVGIGQERSTKSAAFKGVITTYDLDSVKTVPTTEGAFLVCWLRNRTSIGFKEGQYLMLTSQDRPGFWCSGRKTTPEGTKDFRGLVPRDQIAGVEIREFDYGAAKTTALIVIPVVAVLFLVGLAIGGLANM